MLCKICQLITDLCGSFRIFKYITFRAACASLTALMISFVFGPRLIKYFKSMQFGQMVRDDGPQTHLKKEGTPTMGGILIIIAILVPSLLWCSLDSVSVWLVIIILIGYGALGFADDYTKIRRKRSLGVKGKYKLFFEIMLGFIIGSIIFYLSGIKKEEFSTVVQIPFFKEIIPDLGLLYIPFVILVLTGSSNSFNLSDGLDGLAIGLFTITIGTLSVFAYCAGHSVIADYLGIIKISGAGELAVICAAMVGAGLGFLWFNGYPAQIFMGDTGSLSLGGAMGMIAILVKQEILLVILGGLFVAEALSVIIQVLVFKRTGKRVFLMAPLHHHFEQRGWPESKVIIRFWIIALILAVISLSTLKMR
ncbi:MAG: phospho-N-acetylmuramoyl-pentapeptide-transferase [Candidatus Schekmanbacteria bacterium RBG_13_48_7]|uniref:Phospho-N-acetylmuramoyl-pentapeptide-transferase n=1 Tax=Candidatus Schekmanbacteria bacterium RBG_13_48_7 TaxID=1817878 RepID=A0A1F7RUV2_9BACT|nr:MAG: phospho-N-acetylmuramoyl-pentapeptide-transferase [Candidatus Schekmanbacteria bacterium RBG_13_48_7]